VKLYDKGGNVTVSSVNFTVYIFAVGLILNQHMLTAESAA